MFIKTILTVFIIANVFLILSEKIAWKFKILDFPNERKIHSHPTPRTGGIAIFFSFAFSLFLIKPFFTEELIYLLIAVFLIFITGLWDDLFELTPWTKLLCEFTASTIIIFLCGITFKIGGNYTGIINSKLISVFLTYLWIIGVTNAINLIDGMDGLAGGIAFFAFGAILIVAASKGMVFAALISASLIGTTAAFLNLNLPEAIIFLGDSGSLTLGFLISILSLQVSYKTGTVIAVIFPALFVLIPIADTVLSFIRRIAEKKNPLTTPDNKHIHHRLLTLKFSPNQALIIFYFLSGIFTAIAINVKSKNILTSIIASLALILTILIVLYISEKNKLDKKIEKFNNFTDKLKQQLKKQRDNNKFQKTFFLLLGIVPYFLITMGTLISDFTLPNYISGWFDFLILGYIALSITTVTKKEGGNLMNFYEFLLDWGFMTALFQFDRTLFVYTVAALGLFAVFHIVSSKKYAALIPSPPDVLLIFSFLAVHSFFKKENLHITESFISAGILQIARRSIAPNRETEQKFRKWLAIMFGLYLLIKLALSLKCF